MTMFDHLYFCEKLIKISILTHMIICKNLYKIHIKFICKNPPKQNKGFVRKTVVEVSWTRHTCTCGFFIGCLYMYWCWISNNEKGGVNCVTFSLSESNSWIYFIWPEQSFTGLVPVDRGSSRGLFLCLS
jgi:hypothetical protein